MNNKVISLRPTNFKNFIGQTRIVKTIKIVIESSKKLNKPLDHIFFYGPPGRGKTTLANIIAAHTKQNINCVQGALLVQKSDVLTIFANLKENDIVFIDEFHSINKNLEELIYSAMEDNVIDIPVGPEGEQRIVRMKIKPFTLIGATTKFEKISKPIKDRFGLIFKLDPYTIEEIAKIIIQSSNKLNHLITEEQAKVIAMHSQETPRVANNLTKRIIDFAQFYNEGIITNKIIFDTFKHLSIYQNGFHQIHIDYLKLLFEVFEERNVSLDVISSILNETKTSILDNVEPILLSHKLIVKTSRGRKITTKGVDYILKHNINPFKL